MSYSNPTPLEIRISRRLQSAMKRIHKIFHKKFEGDVDFILMISPKRVAGVEADTMHEAPIMSYGATSDRETSALMICELLAKWMANEDIPPLHELRDANGKSLSEILGSGVN